MNTLVVSLRQTYPNTNNDAWMLTTDDIGKLKLIARWDWRASAHGIESIHVVNQDGKPKMTVCFSDKTHENVMFQKIHNVHVAYVYAGPAYKH